MKQVLNNNNITHYNNNNFYVNPIYKLLLSPRKKLFFNTVHGNKCSLKYELPII